MQPDELLRRFVALLERMELPYLVTGSMATIFYGEPRFTNDLDVVVQLPARRVAELLSHLPPEEFYVSPEAALRAVRGHGQFNIIHPASGLKIDVMVPAMDALDRSRFARGLRVHPGADFEATFAAPEDVILKKLQYFALGGSEKHLRDIAGVLKVSGDRVDRAYIERWTEALGLRTIWQRVLDRLEVQG